MSDYNDFYWHLKKIQQLDGSDYGKIPYIKNILAGSFDVWFSEEDQNNSSAQKIHLMKRIKEAGLAINYPWRKDGSIEYTDCWFLTKKGKECLEKEDNKPKSIWRNKYSSLREYYLKNYDQEFYSFDEYQLQIDPDETPEEIAAYSVEKQAEEIEKCKKSFAYFCHKYIKIHHPLKGYIPFLLYKHQLRCFENYEKTRFNIVSKCRQAGLSTINVIYGLWKAMFNNDQNIIVLGGTDRQAIMLGHIVNQSLVFMPEWLQPKKEKWNDHLKKFKNNGSQMYFSHPQAGRGCRADLLIVDEAAFIANMDSHWKCIWPMLSQGGSCIIASCFYSNYMKEEEKNWYKDNYLYAKSGATKFNAIDVDFWEHPDFNPNRNPTWVKECLKNLGSQGFLQEVLRCF